jgi:hypothetical protein
MATNYYVFVDKFTVPCNLETAYQYIKQVEGYPGWWGEVYKKVEKLKDAPPDTAGAKYRVTVGGFLPYALTIENETTLIDRPNRIEFVAFGDLEGKGIWLFKPVTDGTEITFDWRVAANKFIIKALSFLLKPLFRANHVCCVRKAKVGMQQDLQQRQSEKQMSFAATGNDYH